MEGVAREMEGKMEAGSWKERVSRVHRLKDERVVTGENPGQRQS